MNKRIRYTALGSIFELSSNRTELHSIHTGWREGKWEEAMKYFENAWTSALKQFRAMHRNKLVHS